MGVSKGIVTKQSTPEERQNAFTSWMDENTVRNSIIAVCTGDETLIFKNIDLATSTLISIYGEKLGNEAVKTLNGAGIGATYRRNGGPLVKVIDKNEAEFIMEKESSIRNTDNTMHSGFEAPVFGVIHFPNEHATGEPTRQNSTPREESFEIDGKIVKLTNSMD